MRFTTSLIFVTSALAALVSAGANPFTLNATTLDAGFTAGSPVAITWTPTSSGTVTLLLKQGVSTNLDTVSTIVSKTTNSGSFTWTPSTSLVQGSDYALEIVDDDNENNVNYSAEFTINSSVTASASTQSSTATSSLSSSSSSSSAASTSASTSVSSITSTITSASTSATSASTKSSSTTLATKTTSTSSSATEASASSTSTVVSGGAMKLKLGGSMLALVGAVMVAL